MNAGDPGVPNGGRQSGLASVPDDLVVVGRVAGAYGVHGWLKVVPFSGAPDSVLLGTSAWWLGGSPPTALPVAQARAHGDLVIARPETTASREAAQVLRGRDVLVSRAVFPAGTDDDYYWIDLIGCDVVNPAGVALGRVVTLADHGAHSLLVVAGPDGVERLIPFVGQFMVAIDVAARRIVADWDLDY